MTTSMTTAKGTGLVKPSKIVRELSARIEHARQAYNEKLTRAEIEWAAAMRRAVAALDEQPGADAVPPQSVANRQAEIERELAANARD